MFSSCTHRQKQTLNSLVKKLKNGIIIVFISDMATQKGKSELKD